MKKATNVATQVDAVHPLKKSYTLVSTKHVDYEQLNAIEAVSMSLALVMAVLIGLGASVNYL
jgi:hypothetical protein